MRFVADADVHERIIAQLRADGHEVISIAAIGPRILDGAVLAIAVEERAILITSDKDFGELVVRDRHVVAGVVLLRLGDVSPTRRAAIVSAAIAELGERLVGSFTVIEPGNVRSRRLDFS
jgi:predicted nuclease of predicted toxin-antitoxin system